LILSLSKLSFLLS